MSEVTADNLRRWDMSGAIRELRALKRLAAGSSEVFEFVREILDRGAPLLRCEVDDSQAGGAGGGVVRYHLAEGLGELLRARGIVADDGVGDDGLTRLGHHA